MPSALADHLAGGRALTAIADAQLSLQQASTSPIYFMSTIITCMGAYALLTASGTKMPILRWLIGTSKGHVNVRQDPGDWSVTSAVPWAPHQVMLFVLAKP